MRGQEVGRWTCSRCGQSIVAAGPRASSYRGFGAFIGPCPWDCGAWINRSFREIRPGNVSAYRAAEWDVREHSAVS